MSVTFNIKVFWIIIFIVKNLLEKLKAEFQNWSQYILCSSCTNFKKKKTKFINCNMFYEMLQLELLVEVSKTCKLVFFIYYTELYYKLVHIIKYYNWKQ